MAEHKEHKLGAPGLKSSQMIFNPGSVVNRVDELDFTAVPKGTVARVWLNITESALGSPIAVPVLIAAGHEDGPVLGLTAAVHGNEISGIPVIHALFKYFESHMNTLKGYLIACPCVNIPGFQLNQRGFLDGVDLNRVMPGKKTGTQSQQFAHYFFDKFVKKCNFLMDLHTASFGHINSHYGRADLVRPATRQLARFLNCEILLNNSGSGGDGGLGTLRAACLRNNIECVTIEMGDPSHFDFRMVERTYCGLMKVFCSLHMLPASFDPPTCTTVEPVICTRSYWMYTQRGGLLTQHCKLCQLVKQGDKLATITDVFGTLLTTIHAPDDGIIIGMSANPTSIQGGRVVHIGIVKKGGGLDDWTAEQARVNQTLKGRTGTKEVALAAGHSEAEKEAHVDRGARTGGGCC